MQNCMPALAGEANIHFVYTTNKVPADRKGTGFVNTI